MKSPFQHFQCIQIKGGANVHLSQQTKQTAKKNVIKKERKEICLKTKLITNSFIATKIM